MVATIVLVITLIVCILLTLYAVFYLFPEPFLKLALKAQYNKAGLKHAEVEVDGHSVPYLYGGTGEPLLLLHGFGADKNHWPLVAEHLTKHFTVYAPDIPGFGDSSRIEAHSYTPTRQVERIRGFVETLGLGAVHIGGNSMGGFLAGLYAARYPADTKSLWLLAPAGVSGAEPSELADMLEQDQNPLLIDSRAAFDTLIDMCFVKPPHTPGPFKRCLCVRAIEQRDFNAKIFDEMFGDTQSLEDVLANVVVPTLIVWGDTDRILHPSGAGVLETKLQNVRTTIMPQTGHIPMLERPRETGALFLSFHNRT